MRELQAFEYKTEYAGADTDVLRYFDTQSGRLFAQGLRLTFSETRHIWELDGGPELLQRIEGSGEHPPEGPFGEAVQSITKEDALIPFLDAECGDRMVTASRGGLNGRFIIRRASVSEPGSGRKAALPPVLIVDTGSNPSFSAEALDLFNALSRNRTIAVDLLSRGLTLLGLPFPGTPLESNFAVSAGDALRPGLEKIAMLQAYRIWANTKGTLLNLDPE
jgi:hypothetical protein